MSETIISTREIYDGRVVTLRVHQVRLHDGRDTFRELIVHRGAVAVVAINADYEILLVRQYRIGANRETLEVPAGLLEADEAPQATAMREMQEETGYRPLALRELGTIHVSPGYSTERIHLYLAEGYSYAPLPQDDDEQVEVVRIPFHEALARVDDGTIDEAKTVAALLKAARHLGT